MLGSFQWRGGRPTTLAYGRAVLAAGAGRVGFFFFSSCLPYLPFLMPQYLGRRPDILKYCGAGRYNPAVVVSYYWRRAC